MSGGCRQAAVGVTLAAILWLGAGTALGGVEKFDSKLTIGAAVPLYHGKVESPRDRCMRGRTVVLFEKGQDSDRKVGRARTNRRGRWVVRVPAEDLEPQERFYAKARRKLNIVSGEGYVCRGDRSETVTFVGE